MPLSSPIHTLKGIGSVKARVLKEELGLETIKDLLFHFPRKYLDRATKTSISQCQTGEEVTVSGTVAEISQGGYKRKFLQVIIRDETGELAGVFFGGRNFYNRYFKVGQEVAFSGKVSFYRMKQISHPDFDILSEGSNDQSKPSGLTPLYPSTEKLKRNGFDSRGFRKFIWQILENKTMLMEEHYPVNGLPGTMDAFRMIHFPASWKESEQARKRFAFNENLVFQYYMGMASKSRQENRDAPVLSVDDKEIQSLVAALPFTPTHDQEAALVSVIKDMGNPWPMQRLIHGDVGSGKTLVALLAAQLWARRNKQTVIMAPTEVLARQHFATFSDLLDPGFSIALLTGESSNEERVRCALSPEQGGPHIITGTHALFQEKISYHDLALVVIDEQHRFGVGQRDALIKKGKAPHRLFMSATPIPRTMGMTLYGDMDLSAIRELPSGRKPVQTLAFPGSRLKGVFNSMEKYLDQGRQVYYVLPLVEASEEVDLQSAQEALTHITERFPGFTPALLHGRMTGEEKKEVMESFTRGDTHILVTTTVIEVGIDVPNASIIVVEHAERFGLAQLHQLRGRVGRGEHESFCILVTHQTGDTLASQGIETMVSTSDGFIIAEKDLELRGAGDMAGTRQHGRLAMLPNTNFVDDTQVINSARDEAAKLLLLPHEKVTLPLNHTSPNFAPWQIIS